MARTVTRALEQRNRKERAGSLFYPSFLSSFSLSPWALLFFPLLRALSGRAANSHFHGRDKAIDLHADRDASILGEINCFAQHPRRNRILRMLALTDLDGVKKMIEM